MTKIAVLKLVCGGLALAVMVGVPASSGEGPALSGTFGGRTADSLGTGAVTAAFAPPPAPPTGAAASSVEARPVLKRASTPSPAVEFMRRFIARVNPSLLVEDPHCATALPEAIERHAGDREDDWQRLFALAWQESSFDCHAKNRHDPGGAFGPFQIRRLWAPVTGDPRYRYFDPDLAVRRVLDVVDYYRDTARFAELVRRRFRNPLLCLYNTGESLRVNMRYCRAIGDKVERIREEWQSFVREDLRVQLGDGDIARGSG